MRSPWWNLLLSGCFQEWGGATGVGNPGNAQTSTARLGGIELLSGVGRALALDVEDCRGRHHVTSIDRDIDLLDSELFSVWPGRLCGISLLFDPPIVYQGASPVFVLELDEERVDVVIDPPYRMDGGRLIFELGEEDWLTPEEIGRDDDLSSEDEAYGSIASRWRRATLFEDKDKDGLINESERGTPLGSSEEDDDSDDD